MHSMGNGTEQVKNELLTNELFQPDRTIIVTGGAGFIGSNFILYMLETYPDIVVNFAAESHVDRSIEAPSVFLETNITGTAVLMDGKRQILRPA